MVLTLENFGFENAEILLLTIPLFLSFYFYLKHREKINLGRIIFLFTRFLIIFLILIAISSPYTIRVREEIKEISLSILEDKSKSMDLYKNLGESVYSKINSKVGNDTISITLKEFSKGDERTEIGNSLYQETIKESRDNALVLISDGNNNYGRNAEDVARILKETTRIFALTPNESSEEVYISEIGGERKIPVNTEYKTFVKITNIGSKRKEYMLKLFVDEKLVRNTDITQDSETKTIEFLFSFIEPGVHTIRVEIYPKEGQDTFKENNKLSKVVEVVEKPNIFLVSSSIESPLIKVLEPNYKIKFSSQLKNFENYDLVILDNQHADTLTPSAIDSLSKYLTDGNGLVVIGGDNSFEQGDYADSNFERILPVISTEKPKEKRKPIAVLFLIDVSASLGIAGEKGYKSYLEESKAIAINLLRQLHPEDSIAVLAFNVPVFTIVDLTQIQDNRKLIEENIEKLRASDTGGTRFLPALEKAQELLKGYEHESYIVFLSDGVPGGEEEESILSQVKSIKEEGIKIYSVSVGDRAQAKEGQELMQKIARESNGLYFWMEEGQRLNAAFKEEGEEEKEGQYSIEIYDKYHFITKDLTLNTKIKRYNGVTAKSISQLLVTTKDRKPIVTIWRFGLGRVATITTDNGEKWSPNLYKVEEGKLLSRVTNWAIGDLEKKKKLRIIAEDIFLGENAQIFVKSKSAQKPELYIEKNKTTQKKVDLKQVDVDLFLGTFTPEKDGGIYFVKGKSSEGEDDDAIVVSPSREYLTLGINNENLQKIAKITNGSFYNSSEMEKMVDEILKFAKKESRIERKSKEELWVYFILAALTLFFLDVIVRRMKEIIVLRKS